NEKMQLRGTAEYCNSYSSEHFRIKSLEFTPRSVKRFVQRNETTPSAVKAVNRTIGTIEGEKHALVNSVADDGDLKDGSSGNSTTKRSFGVMFQNNGVEETSLFPPVKRAFREECRGRRLFSPLNSQPALSFSALEIAASSSSSRSLSAILEASEEDTLGGITSCKSPLATADLNIRPVESDHNVTDITSTLSSNILHPLIYCSLPNFVIDGEAPHLVNVIASGGSLGSSFGCGVGAASSDGTSGQKKYKLKENIDWLTKIRKQKLLQAAKSITNAERKPLVEDVPALSPTQEAMSLLLSPQLKRLKTCDDRKNSVIDSISNVNVDHTSSPVLVESAACSNSSLPTTPLRRTVSRSGSDCVVQVDVHGNRVGGERTPRRRHHLITPCSTADVIGLQHPSSGCSSIRRFFAVATPNNCSNVLTTL
ncbi:protein lethal(2)denticleless-like, partial [Anopheles cruzii]|uniref:protein lethal(2)denticleless-like n=1 Tax=Anopheles cruzii TaxID=68878 RepID=UPI0022EC2E3C